MQGILLLAFLISLFWATEDPSSSPTYSAETPNIVLIVADDLGTYDLASYGQPVIQTPRLDNMAENGILFNQAYCASPICSPSRAAIVTGLSPARLALTEHIHGFPPPDPCWPALPPKSLQRLPLAYETIGEVLKEGGYHTAYVGKWHLGGGAYKPSGQGYDVSYAAGAAGLPNSYFPPYFNGNPFPELSTIAGDDDYLTDALTTLAVDALPENPDQPFFLHLNYYSPHVPIMGPPDLVEKYEQILGNDPDTLPRPHYAAMVERIDQQVGRLIDTLDGRGILQNTIVLFTSDHGALTVEEVPGFDEHTPPTTNGDLRAGKGYVFEGGLRVPFIVYAPGILEAGIDNRPTINTDLFPTITTLAGVPKTSPDGTEIPSLTNSIPTDRELFWHYPHYSPQGGSPAGVIRKGDLKLIQWYAESDSLDLFDLSTDPGETNDLSNTRPDQVDQLLDSFIEWTQSVDARMMTPNPDYDPANCN